jgi:hypothetical protein
MPDHALAALGVGDGTPRRRRRNADRVDHLRPLEFPGVAEASHSSGYSCCQPLRDDLAEQAEIVADAVADGGDRQRRHALHEAGREPPEAAIAERRIRLAFAQQSDRADAEIAERASNTGSRPILFSASVNRRPIRNSRLR